MAIKGRASTPGNKDKVADVFKNHTLGRRTLRVQASLTKAFCSRYYCICLMILFAAKCYRPTAAQGNSVTFSFDPSTYICSSNVLCLGSAHSTDSSSDMAGLSLNTYTDSHGGVSGIGYYIEPVRFSDPSTYQTVSFNTSFTVMLVNPNQLPIDGFAFVISADNETLGGRGGYLGIFNDSTGNTSSKSIVVEFDGYQNPNVNDMSDNHVGFDFVNINSTAASNASNANVFLWEQTTLYAWVEYSDQTKQLEVRVSTDFERPIGPLLNLSVDLFSLVEEYMWVGFSASSHYNNTDAYAIFGDWTFESYWTPSSSTPAAGGPHTEPSPPPSSTAVAGGPQTEPSPHTGVSHHRLSRLAIDGIIVVAVLALVVGSVFIVHVVVGRWYGGYTNCQLGWTDLKEEDTVVQLEGMPERFSYKQLKVATGNFNKEFKLGQGGFGSVFRGVLPSGVPIAVKKINGDSTQGEREFMAEVSIISQLKHRNLIRLRGWCRDASRGNYLLVYELMPNGSLDKVLFGPLVKGMSPLSWSQRFDIVRNTAAALEYLHQGCTQQVIHRDIKSSNIMLDEKWNAKLGDFGLARLVDHEKTATTTMVAGTRGYIAPEVAIFGKFTDKSDVYAFGAVVLEIACGRKALATYLPDEILLADWVWQKLSEGDLLSTVDKGLQGYDTSWMEVVLKVGLLCSHPNAPARPTMRHIVEILAGDVPMPSIPNTKPSMFCLDPQSISLEEEESQKANSKSRSRSD